MCAAWLRTAAGAAVDGAQDAGQLVVSLLGALLLSDQLAARLEHWTRGDHTRVASAGVYGITQVTSM